MNFVALLLGLAAERALTQLFHLREFRWLDPLFDWIYVRVATLERARGLAVLALLATVIVLPVGLLSALFSDALLDIPYFAFSVVVLLFCLGPRDLQHEINDYCAAIARGDEEDIDRLARELLETAPPESRELRAERIQDAALVQANNRIFGVVFWFLVFGPTGAWIFRVLDLMRRRISFKSERDETETDTRNIVWMSRVLHGLFAWLPARLLALGYAFAGSFEDAMAGWRKDYSREIVTFYEQTETILSRVGGGALGMQDEDKVPAPGERARAAMDLIVRTLWLIWCPIIAVMTLADWLS
jgi:AmpE protein